MVHCGKILNKIKVEMSVNTENSKRLAKNTVLLYIRMALIMVVTLYTSRVVLNALGVEDYGIYNAVGGFVAMFGVISNSLTAAISRFITFELGKGDHEKIKDVFSTSVVIQLIIVGIILLICETLGLWFLNAKMTIPLERLTAANWVYQLSLITFVINIISVPYNACIVAHEKMGAFAAIGVFQALGTLLIAFLINSTPIDGLVFYSILMALLAVIIRMLYGYYCKKNFSECTFRWVFKKILMKEIFSFAGWNFIGSTSAVLRDQGINILLNLFCGVTVNAARGIAMQVSNAVMQFSNNFMTALNPQITKSYAIGDKEYLMKLVFQGSRLSFYLLLFISLPLIIETETVLALWLKTVPAHTVLFVRLILVYVMIESVSFTLITLMLATGKIKNYQIVVGGFQLLIFPLSYIVLKIGWFPESTVLVCIFVAIINLFIRLNMLNKIVELSVKDFILKVVLNVLLVFITSFFVSQLFCYYMPSNWLYFLVKLPIIFSICLGAIFYVGCTKMERLYLIERLSLIKNKIMR